MQDLYTIQKQNTEAVARDIPNQLSKGKYVASEYHGLHFVGFHAFDTLKEAEQKSEEINRRGDSSRSSVQKPHPIFTEHIPSDHEIAKA